MGALILIVEDDQRIRTSLRLLFEEEGNAVSEAESAEEAVESFTRMPADIVLVDLMLPHMDGFELCRRLRRSSDVPILILSARSDSHDVVAGLEAGADDYVVKPAVPKELAARVRALLRRSNRTDAPSRQLVFGELAVKPEAGVVERGGERIAVTRTEFRLLCELAQNAGRVLSREALLERVWGYDYFGDARIVDVHIRRLRMKVEQDPAEPRHIITVRGLGYKLEP